MIKITIDGKEIETTPQASILEAALVNGIDIPRLCYHRDLLPSGGCRLCVVEIEGRRGPIPSCGLKCEEGMVIHTRTEQLEEMRRDIIDLFVSDHPLNCVICDKNGNCDLQRYAYEYNIKETSYDFELSRTLYQDDNPFFVRDHQYCILCGKCVRVCDEIVGANAIDYAERGFVSYISTPFDVPMAESDCVFCGSCVQVCPTAALQTRSRIGKGREWELERKRTICGYCGVGCSLEFAMQNGDIIYAQSYPNAPVNGEFLCVKGRYGWDFADNPDRLTQPLIRKDLAYELGLTDEPWELPDTTVLKGKANTDAFIPVSWEQAIDITATKLAEIIKNHGPEAVAGLTSARCTNEENYIFQKFMRAGVGTNSVDHCARL
jgi:formate dehydrogenase alpha subunit